MHRGGGRPDSKIFLGIAQQARQADGAALPPQNKGRATPITAKKAKTVGKKQPQKKAAGGKPKQIMKKLRHSRAKELKSRRANADKDRFIERLLSKFNGRELEKVRAEKAMIEKQLTAAEHRRDRG